MPGGFGVEAPSRLVAQEAEVWSGWWAAWLSPECSQSPSALDLVAFIGAGEWTQH